MKFRALSLLLLASMAVAAPLSYAEDKAKVKPVVIDSNKDQNISLKESRALAEKQFALYDRNKDGSIEMKEYRVPFDAIAKAKKYDDKKKAMEQKVINDSFVRMDNDQNKKISKAEFLDDADLRHKTMDANKDGMVTSAEIEQLHKRLEKAHKEVVKKN